MSERLNALALESTILTSTSTIYVSIEDDVAGTCLLQAKIHACQVPCQGSKLIILHLLRFVCGWCIICISSIYVVRHVSNFEESGVRCIIGNSSPDNILSLGGSFCYEYKCLMILGLNVEESGVKTL